MEKNVVEIGLTMQTAAAPAPTPAILSASLNVGDRLPSTAGQEEEEAMTPQVETRQYVSTTTTTDIEADDPAKEEVDGKGSSLSHLADFSLCLCVQSAQSSLPSSTTVDERPRDDSSVLQPPPSVILALGMANANADYVAHAVEHCSPGTVTGPARDAKRLECLQQLYPKHIIISWNLDKTKEECCDGLHFQGDFASSRSVKRFCGEFEQELKGGVDFILLEYMRMPTTYSDGAYGGFWKETFDEIIARQIVGPRTRLYCENFFGEKTLALLGVRMKAPPSRARAEFSLPHIQCSPCEVRENPLRRATHTASAKSKGTSHAHLFSSEVSLDPPSHDSAHTLQRIDTSFVCITLAQ